MPRRNISKGGSYVFFLLAGHTIPALLLHEPGQEIDGQREDDGGVLLSRDGVKSLKVAELEGVGRLSDDVSCLLEGPGGILLSLSGNHLVKMNITREI